jgi:hypothetical protein
MTDDLVDRVLEMRYRQIVELHKKIEILQAALQNIETLELDPRNSGQMWVEALRQIARKALGEKDK